MSPIANQRTDGYGGTFDARILLLRRTVRAVRAAWPDELPLAVSLSVCDVLAGGWTLDDTTRLIPLLAADLIDCTSGGIARPEPCPTGPCWQAPYAAAVRHATGATTAAVGKIAALEQAAELLTAQQADLVLMGRQLLVDPMLPPRAARPRSPLWPPPRRPSATCGPSCDPPGGLALLVVNDLGLIFVRTRKTAGTSVEIALSRRGSRWPGVLPLHLADRERPALPGPGRAGRWPSGVPTRRPRRPRRSAVSDPQQNAGSWSRPNPSR